MIRVPDFERLCAEPKDASSITSIKSATSSSPYCDFEQFLNPVEDLDETPVSHEETLANNNHESHILNSFKESPNRKEEKLAP